MRGAGALEDPGDDEHGGVRGQAACRRGEGETPCRSKTLGAGRTGPERAAEQQECRQREGVAGDHPLLRPSDA